MLTRAGCHLCSEMLEVVRAAAGRVPVTAVDLDEALADGRLGGADHDRWTTAVPVLLVDGAEVARYAVTAREARALLGRRRFGS